MSKLIGDTNKRNKPINFLRVIKRTSLEEGIVAKARIINYSFRKRILDLIISFFALIFFFSWLFPLLGLLIKLTSRGPIFYIQSRNGCNGQIINCYKFRTMIWFPEETNISTKYQQATKNDKRVTKFGSFLRKTSLDELPQIWNVLMGEMSLVGPRPHPLQLNAECEDKIKHHHLRYLAKPGITGWAQVNGSRGETQREGTMQKRVNLDIWYIENWSFFLDIKILFKTFFNLISCDKNAY
jgi:putative colanic acid biosynthesis UDP-glucose lipid carrier transferase